MSVDRKAFGRKRMLQLLSVGGIAAVAAYGLREYAPWVDYDAEAARARSALQPQLDSQARLRGIVRYATLAANGHNAQAWKFAIQPNVIEIHPDYSRRLAAVDPTDRELWISLGCALENALIASRAMGYAPVVTYPEVSDCIRISLIPDSPQTGSLFDEIPLRQNTRSEYDGNGIVANHQGQLQKMTLEEGIELHIKADSAGMKILSDYVHQAASRQYADQLFIKELLLWLRFDKKEVLASHDGLYTACAGNPSVPRWLGQRFVTKAKPMELADDDVKKLKSSAGAVVITSAADSKADWVRTGQVYQRLSLTMTALNIKSAFLNQPIEVESVRGQLQSSLGLGSARPQLLVRFGYAKAMPASLRRPVEQVLLTS